MLRFNPFGRRLFDGFYHLAERYGSGQAKQDVDVILHRIEQHRGAAHVFQYRGHVGVQGRTKFIRQEWLSIFRAEYEVNINAG